MRPLLALTSVIALALLLPAAAEAEAMTRHGGTVTVFRANTVFRAHHVRHARVNRLRTTRTTRNAGNLAPFFGSDFTDGGIGQSVADAGPTSGVPFPAFAHLPRRPGDDRATVDVEKGVTVVRGPGSRHLLP